MTDVLMRYYVKEEEFLDQYEVAWVGAQPRRVRVESLYIARPDQRSAEVEVNVPQLRDRFVVPHPGQADGLPWGRRGAYRICGLCLRKD